MSGRYFFLLLCFPALIACADDCVSSKGEPITDVENAWSVATQNLWRLRDDVSSSKADKALSEKLVSQRVEVLANYIFAELGQPHLLLVQEVENKQLLERLADKVTALGGAPYQVTLIEGNDPSGIDVAALHRSPVRIEQSQPLFATAKHNQHWLFSRPPLHLTLSEPQKMDVVVVHLRSGRGLDDLKKAPRVKAKRAAQARALAGWVKQRQMQGRKVLLAGDLNSAFIDQSENGFDQPLSILENSSLRNLWSKLPEQERYSYIFRCQKQAIDHILLSENLMPKVLSVHTVRGNAGRYKQLYASDGVTVVSDHDGLLAWLILGY